MPTWNGTSVHWQERGVNHSLGISGNPYKKSEISYAEARNHFGWSDGDGVGSDEFLVADVRNLLKKLEISYAKCWSDLPLGQENRQSMLERIGITTYLLFLT